MGWVVNVTPRPLYPREIQWVPGRYPLYKRLGRPQGRSGQVRKISRRPGFGHRTVQPAASRYTDWAIPAHVITIINITVPNSHHLHSNIIDKLQNYIDLKEELTEIWQLTTTYTECTRRNVPDFGRVFLMLNYTDITQNTYVQS